MDWLKDCVLSLWHLGLQNELLPQIYKLNTNAIVTINTPYGKTEPFKTQETIKQGAVLASNICCMLCDKDDGVAIGDVIIYPLAFVDDIAKINTTKEDVLKSHARAASFSKLKKLELNETKCYGIIINGGKKDLFPDLYVNEKRIQGKQSVKYLGDINEKNNNNDMLKEREQKAIAKLITIFATVDDITFGAYQLNALLLMYHSFLSTHPNIQLSIMDKP